MIVIGGGDTGADCIGTSLRHGCKSVVNFELLDRPPAEPRREQSLARMAAHLSRRLLARRSRSEDRPRPTSILRAHERVRRRRNGRVKGVKTVELDWSKPGEKAPVHRSPRQRKVWPADLVLLATGFLGPEITIGEMLGVEIATPRGNWETFKAEHGKFATNVDGVFAAGDCRRGQSLVVWAINEGRGAARAIDES